MDDGGGRGGEALAVFGHEEEAEMYLGLWAPGDGWRAREIGAGELASVLRGPSWGLLWPFEDILGRVEVAVART